MLEAALGLRFIHNRAIVREFSSEFSEIMFNGFKGKGGNAWKSRGNFGARDDRGPRPAMHPATCSQCGSACEVPFKPVSGKSIFCRNCFKRDEHAAPKKFERNDRPSRFERNDRFERSDRPAFGGEKQMFPAECVKCGQECQVPFRPNGRKPVYCSNCFVKPEFVPFQKPLPSKDQLEVINSKIDRILELLDSESI